MTLVSMIYSLKRDYLFKHVSLSYIITSHYLTLLFMLFAPPLMTIP